MEILALLGILIGIGGGALWLAASDAAKRDARRADAPISESDDGAGDTVHVAAVTMTASDPCPPVTPETMPAASESETAASPRPID